MVVRYYVDSSSLATSMSSFHDQGGRTASTSNPEQPSWTHEVAASLATRPSRASSLVSTRTKFSTTTFQEDAKSIDLSISGQHFRISRDGSKVTSINPAESLPPPYPLSPLQESLQHGNPHYGRVGPASGAEQDLSNEPSGEFDESQTLPNQNHSESFTANVDPGNSDLNGIGPGFSVRPSTPTGHSGIPDAVVSNSFSELGDSADKTSTPYSMAVRIQRAWRNYVQYRSPSAKSGESTSPFSAALDQPRTIAQNRSTHFTIAAVQQQNPPTSPQFRLDDDVPAVNKSVSNRDKELPIPDEAVNPPVRENGLSFFASLSRRPEARDVERGNLVATPSKPQNLGLARNVSSRLLSTSQLSNAALFPVADGRDGTEQLSLRKWFTGEDTRPFVTPPPETMDSENDVSNHYTRVIRFLDRDHRRALHARDTEMAKLRERLNEQDIIYRQELRARDFLIEDLKKRLDHLEETTEAEIERARNAVEDLWESRWKDRDFHLRERMQRMEAEMQKTMEMSIAEREGAWRARYDELRRRLEASQESQHESLHE